MMDFFSGYWSVLLSLMLVILLILALRTFPGIVGDAFVKYIANDLDRKLEKSKIEWQASHDTLRSSIDILVAGRSELRSRTISSVSNLWDAVLKVKEEFSGVTFTLGVLTHDEITRAISDERETALTLGAFQFRSIHKFNEVMARISALNPQKNMLFIGDRLWLIFFIIQQFHGRLAALVQFAFERGDYQDWREDKATLDALRTVLPEAVIENARKKVVGGPQEIVAYLEAEFLREARHVMSVRAELESLSDVQAILGYESQKISAGLPQ